MNLSGLVFSVAQGIRRNRFLRSLNLRYNVPFADLFIRSLPAMDRWFFRLRHANPFIGSVNGVELYLDINDDEALILTSQPFERRESAVFQHLCSISSGKAILDVGANYGYYSALAVKVGGGGRVIAIEPNLALCGLLERTSGLYRGRIEVVNRAISAVSRDGVLYLSARWSGDARISPDLFEDRPTQAVPFARLDDVVKEFLPDTDVGVIKADIQGHEPDLLRGAKKTLRRSNPYILMEFSPTHLEQAGSPASDVLLHLTESFDVFDVMSGQTLMFERQGAAAQWCERVRFSFEAKGDGYTNLVVHRGNEEYGALRKILEPLPVTRH